MGELKTIKETQERYSQQHLQSQTASTPPELYFLTSDAQDPELRAIDDSIRRLKGIVEELAKGLQLHDTTWIPQCLNRSELLWLSGFCY